MMRLTSFLLLCTVGVCLARVKPPTENCLAGLVRKVDTTSATMCSLVGDFSQCYIDTRVSKTDINSLHQSLWLMSRIMDLFAEEKCDLNDEFNNHCKDNFVHCLKLVTVMEEGQLKVTCNDAAYTSFLSCVNEEWIVGQGPCYFSDWQQRIVNRTRDLQCTHATPPTTTPQDFNDVTSGEGNTCQADNGDRYHVYDGCTVYALETVSGQTRQPVPAGTLFDLSICALNHKEAVKCPSSA